MAGATVTNPEQGGLENKVSVMTAQAVDAWRAVDLDSTVSGPGGHEMPASLAAGLLPFELLLHGWDLAQASGQELHISDELVAYVRSLGEPHDAQRPRPRLRPRGHRPRRRHADGEARGLRRSYAARHLTPQRG